MDKDNKNVSKRIYDKTLPILEILFLERTENIPKCAARILGCLGASLKETVDEFFHYLLQKINTASNVFQIQLALHAMKEYLEVLQANAHPIHAANILSTCQGLLERMESHSLIYPILDVLESLSKYQFAVFKPHFHDVIDLLVGIYLDPETSSQNRELIESKSPLSKKFILQRCIFNF